MVAAAADQGVKADPFGTQDNGGLGGPRDRVPADVALAVEAEDPVAALLERFEGLSDVDDADNRSVFEGSSGGFGYGFGEPGGAAFGDDDSAGSGGIGGADDGAEIVRILHTVEDDEHASTGGDVVERGVGVSGSEGDDTLVDRAGGEAVECVTRLESDWDTGFAAGIDDVLDAGAAGSSGDNHPVQ
jgi:hypothetical protein